MLGDGINDYQTFIIISSRFIYFKAYNYRYDTGKRIGIQLLMYCVILYKTSELKCIEHNVYYCLKYETLFRLLI
jgi:hypothetical protein